MVSALDSASIMVFDIRGSTANSVNNLLASVKGLLAEMAPLFANAEASAGSVIAVVDVSKYDFDRY